MMANTPFFSAVGLFSITLVLEKGSEPKSLKMKRIFKPLPLIFLVALASSCTTLIQLQKTYPPEAVLPAEIKKFAFVNFYDYRIPEFIKDKHEGAYAEAVKGYATGLGELVLKDPGASFLIADTLREGFTVMAMQLPEFTDTISAICSQYGANLLVALDSIRLWVDWEMYLSENDEGSNMLAKDFYLYSNTYMTLYTAEGEVLDRCAGEKNTYVKSKYTIFGMFGGPNVTNQKERIRLLTESAARDCIGKYYPFTEQYTGTLYSGGEFTKLNLLIIEGKPEEAIGQLTELSHSSSASVASKAEHNLAIANEIIENNRLAKEIWSRFDSKDE